jgi:hypothetical protein
MSKLPYTEGTWFAVPLRDGGYGVGVVSRMAPKGRVLVGYFFGPKREKLPSLDDMRGIPPEDAVLVQKFGDLYLVQGRWPILGRDDRWQREQWPMPLFGRVVEIDGTAWSVEYQDDNPNSIPREARILPAEAERLPNDALLGAGVVEVRLTKQLGPGTGHREGNMSS